MRIEITSATLFNLSNKIEDFLSEHLDSPSDMTSTRYVETEFNGTRVEVTGTGFQYSSSHGLYSLDAGTIETLSILSPEGDTIGAITGLNWDISDLRAALLAANDEDFAPLAALIDGAGPITLDASGADYEVFMPDLTGTEVYALLTTPMTIIGSEFSDDLLGGSGADVIRPGSNSYGGDGIYGSLGDDTIDLSGVSAETFVALVYREEYFRGTRFGENLDGPFTFDIDAIQNTGSITGSGFTDTILDTRRGLEADGIGFVSGDGDDVFNITSTADGWFWITAYGGNDTYNLTLNGGIGRVSFYRGEQGVVANLNTGVVSNDGRGFTDQINIYGAGTFEVNASEANDHFIGSDRSERFILNGGNNTVDGGLGDDTVRYDRYGNDWVDADLAAGTAQGVRLDDPFSDSLTNIENLRGTPDGDDTLAGDKADNHFLGRGGDDLLLGRAGDDRLEGEDGNDSIAGGSGDDVALGGDGADQIKGDRGNDTLSGSYGDDSIHGGADDDRVFGGDGRDLLFGGNGDDMVAGGTGADTIKGGAGDDMIAGGGQNDLLEGGTGNDTLRDGGGRDILIGEAGADVFELRADKTRDVIRDFELGIDTIRLQNTDFASLQIDDIANGRVEISYDGNSLVLLEQGGPLQASDFTAADFEFF